MNSNEEYRILLLRNQASMKLDDLTAIIEGAALSREVRNFSEEVMKINPNFVFGYKQAKALKGRTYQIYKDYTSRIAGDGEVMDYLDEARGILKGTNNTTGGSTMGFFDFFGNKEKKQREAADKLLKMYESVSRKIIQCEAEKQKAVDKATGHSKDSQVYRDASSTYKRIKDRIKLYQNQQNQLRAQLDKWEDIQIIKEYNKLQGQIKEEQRIALGDQKANDYALQEALLNIEDAKADAAYSDQYSLNKDGILDSVETQTDSDFDVDVIMNERRKTAMEASGLSSRSEVDDEFDQQVKQAQE